MMFHSKSLAFVSLFLAAVWEAPSAAAFSASSDRRSFLQTTVGGAVASVFLPLPQTALALDVTVGGKIQYGDESIMSPKAHGTSEQPVQSDLLYGVSNKLADKICNFNRYDTFVAYFRLRNIPVGFSSASKQPLSFSSSPS